MKLKCTALGSYVMTAKPSQRGIEIQGLSRTSYIKFQNFQGPIPFSRTFQVLEKWKKISRTFKNFQGRVATLLMTHTEWHTHSLRFNGHFPRGPGLAGTSMSPFWILLKLRMMEVVSGDNWSSCKMCKAPVKMSPPTNQHPVFLQAGCPSYRPTNSVKALKGKTSNILSD